MCRREQGNAVSHYSKNREVTRTHPTQSTMDEGQAAKQNEKIDNLARQKDIFSPGKTASIPSLRREATDSCSTIFWDGSILVLSPLGWVLLAPERRLESGIYMVMNETVLTGLGLVRRVDVEGRMRSSGARYS